MSNARRKAEKLFEEFHQFESMEIGDFRRDFRVPREAAYVGHATTMLYSSDKLNPVTGEDEGCISYFHEHKDGVRMYLPGGNMTSDMRSIPEWIWGAGALVRLGVCDGFEYQDFYDKKVEAKATDPKPEWYAIPSGKALLVIQDKSRVLAIAWGGKLNVEWRGVVG